VQVWGYLNAGMIAIQNTYLIYRLGLSTEEDWNSVKKGVNGWLGFPFGRIWWDETKATLPTPFVEEIDAVLKDTDPLYAKHAVDRMQAAAMHLRQE
jgi:hypothetical protein